MTVKRRILTRLLTVSYLNHIYISLQQTYRIKTSNPQPEKSMYITEDSSVNTTHVFQRNLLFLPLSNQDGEEPLPSQKEAETMRRGCGRRLGHQSTSIIQLSKVNSSKHILSRSLNFLDFFVFFFFVRILCGFV